MSYVYCSDVDLSDDSVFITPDPTLIGETHKQPMTIMVMVRGTSELIGMPIIPANVKADTYTGSFTITYILIKTYRLTKRRFFIDIFYHLA